MCLNEMIPSPIVKTFASPLALAVMAIVCGLHAQDTGNVIPFQGQLANQAGQPLSPTNAVTLVFRLYQVPVGGVAIWEESQPNISVNAGRFSVLLGSRTLLPAQTYFNSTLYLGITVDDGNPATADVELRPRQALVPVVSASYAKNAGKLNGYDWSALFGTNNPVDGKLDGSRIAVNSITAAQIASGTITSNQIASGTITANQIAPGGVTQVAIASGAVGSVQIANGGVGTQQIAVGGIQTSNLADGSVTQSKLSSRQSGTNIVGAGGVAVSQDSGTQVLTSATPTYINNLTATITTTGRPVFVGLIGSASPVESLVAVRKGGGSGNESRFEFLEGTNVVGSLSLGLVFLPTPTVLELDLPPSSFHTISTPPAGTWTYRVRCNVVGADFVEILAVRLLVYEL
jgi:hypothetical protein